MTYSLFINHGTNWDCIFDGKTSIANIKEAARMLKAEYPDSRVAIFKGKEIGRLIEEL